MAAVGFRFFVNILKNSEYKLENSDLNEGSFYISNDKNEFLNFLA